MTAATSTPSSGEVTRPDDITLTIDGVEVAVPKGTLVIRAAEQIGTQIPRFCDHPLLKPAGACRQCLVEVSVPDREGNVRPMPKPQTACTLEVSPGMVVATQHTSAVADKAQHGQMEFLLINHPLDCPVCDKGGECPLQNQAMSNGAPDTRFTVVKRTFPKPIKISTEILLDRDRCILCQRCTRFSDEIAGDPFIELQGRGGGTPGHGGPHGQSAQQIGAFDEAILQFTPLGDTQPPSVSDSPDMVGPGGGGAVRGGAHQSVGHAAEDVSGRPFSSYFSGNTIQICPVGALTSATYRFRSRPFDLVSTDSIAEHDACGSAIRIDSRRGVVVRRLAGDDPAVNEEWITDKDRFAFTWQSAPDQIDAPMVRDESGELVATSWSEALAVAAQGLAQAARDGGVGVLPGGRLTLEDAYAWSKFARAALGSNDIDFRARAHSDEEAQFLGHQVASAPMDVTFSDLESAEQVLLVGLEPEEEAGTIFLRLRKGVLAGNVNVTTIAPLASRGTTKLRATLIPAAPGAEAGVLQALADGEAPDGVADDAAQALAKPGVVVLAGERLAGSAGGYSALLSFVRARGARLAWVPRRAGDRGAVEAGLLPGLLPGGRPVTDAEARVDLAALWGAESLPDQPGRDLSAIIAAAGSGELGGLLIGGVHLSDLPQPGVSERAIRDAGFVVQVEVRESAVTRYADVVLPVVPPSRKSGTYLNWEGRPRPFGAVFETPGLSDGRVLDLLARELGVDLGTGSPDAIYAEFAELGGWNGARIPAPELPAPAPVEVGDGEAVLASWRLMLDAARGQDGEPHLAGTAHRPVARMSAGTAAAIGVADGQKVTVTGPKGAITLPLVTTPMPPQVVWLPLHSPGSSVYRMLGAQAGQSVKISPTTAAEVTA